MIYFNKLNVNGLRAYSQVGFTFQPGMNLLVGINGVGKTTILQALRVCLSTIVSEALYAKMRKEGFKISDIKNDVDTLKVYCDFTLDDSPFNLLIVNHREKFRGKESGNSRDQGEEKVDQEIITPSIPRILSRFQKTRSQPIGIYFSTKRSLISEKALSRTAAVGGQAAAYVDALSENREFNLKIFAAWFKAQQALVKDTPAALKSIEVLKEAIKTFLPSFTDLAISEEDGEVNFTINKAGTILKLQQLSDGERGMLALVLDIARRLLQANPLLENPLEANGIILIDELDLHLHPKWQRTIVDNLIRVFPNCQFIATTHSPQIIPTLEPENIQLIKDNEVIRPDRSLGMDSNWILKHLMEDGERPKEAIEAIEKVEELISEGDFDDAKKMMAEYKSNGYDFPEWSVFEARIARLEIISDKE